MSLPKLTTPTYELTIPSTGKVVKYRPFLVKEHKILLTLSEADNQEVSRVVKDLIQACTFGAIQVDKLAHFDIEYIFLQLRAKSIGENVDVYVNCECGNKIETSFNIEHVTIEKDDRHSNRIMLSPQYGVEMSYPKFSEVVDVFSSNDTSKIVELIIKCIVGVYDSNNYWSAEDQTKEEVEEFVYSMTKEQFDLIEDFFVTAPKVVQTIETDCDQCGKHNVSRLEGLSNFFV